jgi:hypothetical protein
VTLTNVVVTDSLTGGTITCPSVAPGEDCVLVTTYLVTPDDVVAGVITNVATATSNETPPATVELTTPVICIPKDINYCIALDMSGSICSPTGNLQTCGNCPGSCQQSPFNQNICCNNFNTTVAFADGFIVGADAAALTQQFALVTFATNVQTLSPLTSASNALSALAGIDYSGGSTNTGGAIDRCRTILGTGSDPERVTVLITDGNPTNPTAATTAANIYKNGGGTLATVFVQNEFTNQASEDFLAGLASPGLNFTASFDDLLALVDRVVALAGC